MGATWVYSGYKDDTWVAVKDSKYGHQFGADSIGLAER